MPGAPSVLVVGAGAVGAACAAALARCGLRVQVLAHPQRSTTVVSGGHLLLQSRPPGPTLELARRGTQLVAELARGRERELGYRRRGSLVLAADAAEDTALRHHAGALLAAGVPVEVLDGAAVRKLEPGVSPGVLSASYCPGDAQVDPAALARAWLAVARSLGAALLPPAPAERLLVRGGAVRGVVCADGEREAEVVVLAGGPWSGILAATADLDLGIEPRRGVLLPRESPVVLAGRPLLGASYLQAKQGQQDAVAFSFQQHPDGRCLLGGSRELCGFSTVVPEELRRRILDCAARYLPAVSERSWPPPQVGFRPWCRRGKPWIGPCGVPGLLLACGHEGDGITLAAATAERIAGHLTGRLGEGDAW